jgi:hypothetical protein
MCELHGSTTAGSAAATLHTAVLPVVPSAEVNRAAAL